MARELAAGCDVFDVRSTELAELLPARRLVAGALKLELRLLDGLLILLRLDELLRLLDELLILLRLDELLRLLDGLLKLLLRLDELLRLLDGLLKLLLRLDELLRLLLMELLRLLLMELLCPPPRLLAGRCANAGAALNAKAIIIKVIAFEVFIVLLLSFLVSFSGAKVQPFHEGNSETFPYFSIQNVIF